METKTCSVCCIDKPTSDYHSNGKGRKKPYCKTCKPIYDGIRSGLIDESMYKGLDFDTRKLEVNRHGYILLIKEDGRYLPLDKESAVRYVKQGGGFIVSPSVIERIGGDNKAVRTAVKKRDQSRCHYCGSKDAKTMDHLIPRVDGGIYSLLNIVCACSTCNQTKADRTKSAFLLHPEKVTTKNTRTCIRCKEVVNGKDFEPNSQTCNRCSPYQKPLDLGFVTQETVNTIPRHRPKLHNTLLVGVKGENLGVLKKGEAKTLLEKGLVRWDLTHGHLQLLFEPNQIKQLYPHDPWSLQKPVEKPCIPPPVTLPNLTIQTKGGWRLGVLSEQEANTLREFKLGNAEGPTFTLTDSLSNTLVLLSKRGYPLTSGWITSLSKQRRKLITGAVVARNLRGERELIEKETALQLIEEGKAVPTGKNRIHLAAEEVFNQKTVRLFDREGRGISNIAPSDLEVLGSKGVLIAFQDGYQLTRPIYELVQGIDPSDFSSLKQMKSLLRFHPAVTKPTLPVYTRERELITNLQADDILYLLRKEKILVDSDYTFILNRGVEQSIFLQKNAIGVKASQGKKGKTVHRETAIQWVLEKRAVITTMNRIKMVH